MPVCFALFVDNVYRNPPLYLIEGWSLTSVFSVMYCTYKCTCIMRSFLCPLYVVGISLWEAHTERLDTHIPRAWFLQEWTWTRGSSEYTEGIMWCVCMCMYVRICLYVHMCVCMYMHLYVHIRMCVHVYACTYIYTYMCLHVCTYIRMYVTARVCTYLLLLLQC